MFVHDDPKKFNNEMYELLLKCSEKNDFSAWNKIIEDHKPSTFLINLNGANLIGFYLEGIDLWGVNLKRAKLKNANLKKAKLDGGHFEQALFEGSNLEHATLTGANLHGACFKNAKLNDVEINNANLQKADFTGAELKRANIESSNLYKAILWNADLESAKLKGANLEKAYMPRANLKNANLGDGWSVGKIAGACMKKVKLDFADLENASLIGVDLEGATLVNVNLKGANFWHANLRGAFFNDCLMVSANFRFIETDGATCIKSCHFDRYTDFRGSAIDNIRWDPGLKQLSEYNNRRLNWEKWYNNLKWSQIIMFLIVWIFWFISDYGKSTKRIIITFGCISILFSSIYYYNPGLLQNIQPDGISLGLQVIRTLYFSVVTMTTLGFGDIYAVIFFKKMTRTPPVFSN